jgi:hypothetical protein
LTSLSFQIRSQINIILDGDSIFNNDRARDGQVFLATTRNAGMTRWKTRSDEEADEEIDE